MRYTITQSNLHLVDSYKVVKRKFDRELAQIKGLHPNSDVWKRSFRSIRMEWATHNALYALHLFRSRTKDCDLNYPQKWYARVAYAVAGTLVWPFIK